MRECPECKNCYSDEVEICPNDQKPTRHALPGSQLLASRYFLEKQLGKGAMGQVYLATDRKFKARKVAVKTVRQDLLNSEDLQEGEAISRFEREAESAASIQHPNTVSVTDFGETPEGVFYLVMEYVEGETLHRLLRREGTLSVKRAVKLLRQISDGVEAAHDAGILHRDLKPANIFIMQTGRSHDDGFIKVGDFGLAKIVNQTMADIDSKAGPTSRGIIGTPEFMAPEQMQPELGVDGRADLYALGTIAYLMLGGRTPFTGDLMQLVMQKIMHAPPLLSTLRTDIPSDVERAIMSSLETDANRRPSSVTEWISELEKAAEDVDDKDKSGAARLVILAPVGAEVYINDERKGSIGSSGKLVLSSIPTGQHILRVSKAGEKDDERVIELREGGQEQVIQAQLKPLQGTASQPSPSHSSQSGMAQSSIMPGIVACTNCQARFAEGVKFCGRCGNRSFTVVSAGLNSKSYTVCPRCSTQLPQNSKFCGRCGMNFVQPTPTNKTGQSVGFYSGVAPPTPQPVQRICRKCGASFPPNIKFCGRCGAGL
ncbi:MAG TPA: protein kinase [Pyrinomonadaceae bacterium]|nr:protein kinase [Pyrinomonadaceae bacterium]